MNLLCAALAFLPGCGSVDVVYDKIPVERTWPLAYREIVTVETDPPGALVRVDEQPGLSSPSDFDARIGPVMVREQGFASYLVRVSSLFHDDEDCEEFVLPRVNAEMVRAAAARDNSTPVLAGLEVLRPVGPTRWEGAVKFHMEPRELVVTAILDGFRPATQKVIINESDPTCREALGALALNKPHDPPKEAVGRRTVLIRMEPLSAPAKASAGE